MSLCSRCESVERENERDAEDSNAARQAGDDEDEKRNSTSWSLFLNLQKQNPTEERSDDGYNAAPRHPNLVPVEDVSIPSWKRSTGGTANSAPPPAAEAAAPGAASAAPGAEAQASPAAAANGIGVAPAAAEAGEAAVPVDAEGGA